MSGRVSDLSERPLRRTAFFDPYPRIERTTRELSEAHVPREWLEELPEIPLPETPESRYVGAVEAPLDQFSLRSEFRFDSLGGPMTNTLLVFRLLQRGVGQADVVGLVTAGSAQEDPNGLSAVFGSLDWSFSFEASELLVAEGRSLFLNTRHVIRVWERQAPVAKPEATGLEPAARFVHDLIEACEANLHLFEEAIELKKPTAPGTPVKPGIVNLFWERYGAAESMAAVVSPLDPDVLWNDEGRAIATAELSESAAIGAAILYTIASEAFVNLLYWFLIKEEFDRDLYRRLTNRSDLDLRVATLHVFCRGFSRVPIEPGTELWKQMTRLKDFRNDVLHGNLTREHEIHLLAQDHFVFYYAPFRDYRGARAERETRSRIPRMTRSWTAARLVEIKGIVDGLVSGIIEAMDAETGIWVRSWLHEEMVCDFVLAESRDDDR